jgi:hypothetical protein
MLARRNLTLCHPFPFHKQFEASLVLEAKGFCAVIVKVIVTTNAANAEKLISFATQGATSPTLARTSKLTLVHPKSSKSKGTNYFLHFKKSYMSLWKLSLCLCSS